MKTKHIATGKWAAVGLSVLTATATFQALADDSGMAAKPEKTYTGTVVSVDAKERTLHVKGYFLSKTFNLGDHCVCTLVDKEPGTVSDLHPGQRVTVSYQDARGVLVAGRVAQQPMREEGTVKAIDPVKHTLTLHPGATDKLFQLPEDCVVVLRGGKPGTLANIQTGNYVTVTYEIPNGKATARKIAQTSATFTGSLTAVDLDTKTVKAKALFDTKKFTLGDNCAIVIKGKINGQLSDLKPKDKLVFSYDAINGVNVANRIAPAGTPPPPDKTAIP